METGAICARKRLHIRAALTRKYQVLSGPIPHILHEKIRKSTKDSRIFSFCLNEIWLAQNCFAPQKVRFRCQTRRKAQKYLCVFRAFSTKYGSERSFLRLVLPYQGRPFRGGVLTLKNYILSGAVTPMMARAFSRTTRVASASLRRARSTFSSASLMRQAL